MLAASLDAEVPEFIASPTSAWARAGASFVPSPVIATRWPSACSRRMIAILSSGLASATKSSTPASRAMVAAVSGLSPVIMIVRTPIARNSSNRFDRPGLTVSFSSMRPMTRPFERIARGVAPAPAMASDSATTSAGMRAVEIGADRIDRALEDLTAVGQGDAAGPGLGAERLDLDDRRVQPLEARRRRRSRRARPSSSSRRTGQLDDRTPLRRLVADRGHEGRGQRLGLRHAGRGHDPRGQSIAERDRAGLVEQDDVDVTGRLDRPAAHREDVEPCDAVHAGDPDRREQAADRRRDEADEQGDQLDDADGLAGEDAERPKGHDRQQEDDGQAAATGSTARSRWGCAGASRPRRARSSGRGRSRPGWP